MLSTVVERVLMQVIPCRTLRHSTAALPTVVDKFTGAADRMAVGKPMVAAADRTAVVAAGHMAAGTDSLLMWHEAVEHTSSAALR